MRDEALISIVGIATTRLLSDSWFDSFHRACARFRRIGYFAYRHRTDGAEALLKRLKRVRPSTYYHSVRVARMARQMGRAFNLDDAQMRQLTYAAVLHDVGKIFIPERVLEKPRRLTRPEIFLMNLHPNLGALLAFYFNLPPELRIRIQHHHERWDGKGYPNKIGGSDIPLMARILQVADTYDAMVIERPYRKPATHEEAIAELRKHSGKQFDPKVVELFLDTFEPLSLS